jgi:endoglucanase
MKNSIFVNQTGYLLNRQKLAFIDAGKNDSNNFSLCTEGGKVVFSSDLSEPVKDTVSGQTIRAADFSSFTKKGSYYISAGEDKSFVFQIGDKVYDEFLKSILTYFTYSRCGQEVKAGKWSHPACHTKTAEIYGSTEKKQVLGGWHDAGDYGRYVVAGTKAVMDLLLAYDCIKDFYKGFDILEEVRFELEWLLQMQREDGAVYHKISCYNFCRFISPEKEKDAIVLSPVSTAATADFAGCLSFAYRFFREKDADFAHKLLDAAVKAQKYLDKHSDEFYKNPPEITTGGYGDHNVKDERYFALCGLYSATGEQKYLKDALKLRKKKLMESYFWGCVTSYGTEILLRYTDLGGKEKYRKDLEKAIIQRADKIYELTEASSYKTALTKVHWGSNGFVCDEAHLLLLAYKLSGKEKYYNAGLNQINYVLGCNPFNLSYVTKTGSSSVKRPHHRPSGAVKEVMPGMLAGGPSEGLQDEVAKQKLSGKSPLLCYIDDECSFSTNEVAIYWNSALVCVLAMVMAY